MKMNTLSTVIASNPIPFNSDDGLGAWLLIKTLVVAACLLLATYGVLLLLKRKGLLPSLTKPRQSRRLEVVESYRLSQRTTLFLLRRDDKTILVSESTAVVTALIAGDGGDDVRA